MQTVLRKFMEEIAFRNQIEMAVAEGVFTNTPTNKKTLSLPGATYGFCVRLSEQERDSVFNEAKIKQTTRLTYVEKWLPINEDIYPLYWGKDKMLGARVHQHLKNTKKTGLARLCAYTTLHGKEIACVALTVSKYSEFEAALHRERPHLLLSVTRVL